MIVFVGIPDQEIKINKEGEEGIDLVKLQFNSFSCNSLGSIVNASDKLYEVEKRFSSVLTSIHTFLKTTFHEETASFFQSVTKGDYENKTYSEAVDNKIPFRTKRKLSERRLTIEEYISKTETSFREIEKDFSEKHNEFIKYIKRNEIEKKKLFGNLKEASLNNFIEKEEFEFLKVFFVVKEKKNKNLLKLIFENEKLTEFTTRKVAEDENYELFSFIGMKSSEEKVKEDCKALDFTYKTFLPDDVYENVKKMLMTLMSPKKYISFF